MDMKIGPNSWYDKVKGKRTKVTKSPSTSIVHSDLFGKDSTMRKAMAVIIKSNCIARCW